MPRRAGFTESPANPERTSALMTPAKKPYRRTLFIGIGIALFIGFLCIPIDDRSGRGSAPFRIRHDKSYRIENDFGRVWEARLQYVTKDSLFQGDAYAQGLPLSQIARVSLDGRVCYLNPDFPLRQGEKVASEGEKWPDEERWTVGGYLLLLALDAMGMIH
jgi:hypothetical protein